jgi:hypothetical protein
MKSLSLPSSPKWQKARRLLLGRRRLLSLLQLHHHRRDPSDLPLRHMKNLWPTILMLPYVELALDAYKPDISRILTEN